MFLYPSSRSPEDHWNYGFCSLIFVLFLDRPNAGRDKGGSSGIVKDDDKIMYSVVIDGTFCLLILQLLMHSIKKLFKLLDMRYESSK
jgi:hypothetical protein